LLAAPQRLLLLVDRLRSVHNRFIDLCRDIGTGWQRLIRNFFLLSFK
jgi:hypothetical protein